MWNNPSTKTIRGGESFTPKKSAPAIKANTDASNMLKWLKSAGLHSEIRLSNCPSPSILRDARSDSHPYGVAQHAANAQTPKMLQRKADNPRCEASAFHKASNASGTINASPKTNPP